MNHFSGDSYDIPDFQPDENMDTRRILLGTAVLTVEETSRHLPVRTQVMELGGNDGQDIGETL